MVFTAGRVSLGTAGWAATMVRERVAILAASERPVVAIVAGSGGLFGISADQMEREIHKPVVNASSDAGLSWRLLEREILDTLQPGDTVLLPLELIYYARDPNDLNSLTVETAQSLGLDFFWSLPFEKKVDYMQLLSWAFIQRQLETYLEGEPHDHKGGYRKFATLASGDLDISSAKAKHAKVAAKAPKRFKKAIAPEIREALCASIKKLRAKHVRSHRDGAKYLREAEAA